MRKQLKCPKCGRYNIRKIMLGTGVKPDFFRIKCAKCNYITRIYVDNRIGNLRAVIEWKWQEGKAWKKGR